MYKKDSYERINANLGVTYNLYKNLKLTSYNVFSITNRNISNGLEYGRNPFGPSTTRRATTIWPGRRISATRWSFWITC